MVTGAKFDVICRKCGEVGLYFLEDPMGKIVDVNTTRKPNGKIPQSDEWGLCGHCKSPLLINTDYLIEFYQRKQNVQST